MVKPLVASSLWLRLAEALYCRCLVAVTGIDRTGIMEIFDHFGIFRCKHFAAKREGVFQMADRLLVLTFGRPEDIGIPSVVNLLPHYADTGNRVDDLWDRNA